MNKTIKALLGILALFIVIALFTTMSKKEAEAPQPEENLGGLIETLPIDFTAGLRVNGTTVISSTRAISASSLTTTAGANLGVVGSGAYVTRPVLAPSADTTLTVAQSGAIVQMGVAGLDVTLPAATASAGVEYRFVVSAAVATTNMTIIGDAADLIEGTLIVAGAVVDCDATDVLNFVIDGENIGDYVELYSDGTKWMIGDSGVLTAAKLTCTG